MRRLVALLAFVALGTAGVCDATLGGGGLENGGISSAGLGESPFGDSAAVASAAVDAGVDAGADAGADAGSACSTTLTATPTTLFDADNIDGTNNSSFTDSDPIAAWVDLGNGANAANMVQAGADSLKPTAVENCVGTHWCASADGGDSLTSDTSHLAYLHKAAGSTCLMVVVVDADSDTAAQAFVGSANGTNQHGVTFAEDSRSGSSYDRAGFIRHHANSNTISMRGSNGAFTYASAFIMVYRAGTFAGDDADMRASGASVGSTEPTAGYSASAVSSQNGSLFSTNNGAGLLLTGDIAYVACFDSRLSDVDVATNEAAIDCKYDGALLP